jgi:hypothetical protein
VPGGIISVGSKTGIAALPLLHVDGPKAATNGGMVKRSAH